MAIAPSTSPGGVSMSSASRSIRGRMMSRTARSPRRSASVATACSTASRTPSARPASRRCSMSSTDTVGPSCLWAPSMTSTADVEAPISHTNGRVTCEKIFMAGAARRAKSSARRSASRLGTSSPNRSVTNDSSTTNTVRAIGLAMAPTAGEALTVIHSARSLTRLSPP